MACEMPRKLNVKVKVISLPVPIRRNFKEAAINVMFRGKQLMSYSVHIRHLFLHNKTLEEIFQMKRFRFNSFISPAIQNVLTCYKAHNI